MNGFVPDQPKLSVEVPWFDDVDSSGGWEGHTTSKTVETLKSEIMASASRLGAMVTGFMKGTFAGEGGRQRDGFQMHFTIEAPNHQLIPGRLDIAALPVRLGSVYRRGGAATHERRREQSLKMALFMLKRALDGQWFLQQLSPGYSALIPWMLTDGERTVSQLWSEGTMRALMPPTTDQFDGEENTNPILDAEPK